MNALALDQISAALREHAEGVATANRKLFATLKATPGGEEMFRREMATLNLDRAIIDRVMSGEMSAADATALAGLKIGNS